MRPRSEMQLEVQRRDDVAVLIPNGRITEVDAYRIEEQFEDVLASPNPRLVVDLADVTFLTSAFLGTLVATMQRSKAAGGYIRLVAPQPLVAEVFATTKLDKLLPIFPSVEAAIEAK